MKRSWQIFWHIAVWVVFVGFFMILAINDAEIKTEDLLVIFLLFPAINITLFYLNYLVLIPKFLDTKKYGIYAASIIVAVIFYGFAKYGVALVFKQYVLMRMKGHITGFGSYFLSTVFTSLVFLFLSAVLKFTGDWFLNERK